MNMFKPTTAKSIAEYFSNLPDERRPLISDLHNFIQKTVPGLRPYFANNMIGYGSFKYLNYKKQTVDWPIIALANQKNYVSIYVCAVEGRQYMAEKYKDNLGKVQVGRSCIRFKKLNDVNLPVLARVLREAANHPGLIKD